MAHQFISPPQLSQNLSLVAVKMSSTSSNDGFWTKTSGICTIIGLAVGSVLTIGALVLTVLSFRQMKRLTSHSLGPATPPIYGEPPPPYAEPIREPKDRENGKKTNTFNSSSSLEGSDEVDVDAIIEREASKHQKERRKRRLGAFGWLGRQKCFILLLIILIILAGGMIGLAANISNIQKLSSTSFPKAAALPNYATVSFSTTLAAGASLSTTLISGTPVFVVSGPTTVPATGFPTGIGSTTTINGTEFVVISPTTIFIPLSTMDSAYGTTTATIPSTTLVTSPAAKSTGPSTTEAALNPLPTESPSSGYTYQGCITDSDNRTLGGAHTTTDFMTTDKCATYCAGSVYFGTEYGSQCWCGDEVWQYAGIAANQSDCNTPCTGDNTEICGATWLMSLYQFN